MKKTLYFIIVIILISSVSYALDKNQNKKYGLNSQQIDVISNNVNLECNNSLLSTSAYTEEDYDSISIDASIEYLGNDYYNVMVEAFCDQSLENRYSSFYVYFNQSAGVITSDDSGSGRYRCVGAQIYCPGGSCAGWGVCTMVINGSQYLWDTDGIVASTM